MSSNKSRNFNPYKTTYFEPDEFYNEDSKKCSRDQVSIFDNNIKQYMNTFTNYVSNNMYENNNEISNFIHHIYNVLLSKYIDNTEKINISELYNYIISKYKNIKFNTNNIDRGRAHDNINTELNNIENYYNDNNCYMFIMSIFNLIDALNIYIRIFNDNRYGKRKRKSKKPKKNKKRSKRCKRN